MANILLLDDNDVAGRAMQGILARGHHTCFVATTPDEAWRVLREAVVFDLVFIELKTSAGAGLPFLQRLRNDWFWKILPVVIYTYETDGKQVRKALALSVQNYLIKPFNDQLIYAEIGKAMKNPWRNLHFEESKSFCAMTNLGAETLTQMRRDVMIAFDEAAKNYPDWATERQNEEVFARTSTLINDAESAGVWAGVDFLRDLQEQAAVGHWGGFKTCAEFLEYASRLIFCQLNPSYMPDLLRSPTEQAEAKEAAERARWLAADVERNGPVTDRDALCKQIDALSGCPVIDTVAAGFQMVADGRAAGMAQVMDFVTNDPGLCAQVLVAANKAEHDDMTAIEDARAGASLLGELKLNALGKALPIVRERDMNLPPLTWPNFWMFQVAVGRVGQFICSYLELGYLSGNVYTAGLMHDIGKLFLLKLHPAGLEAVMRYAREKKVPVAVAEQKYLGCTTRELALHFAQTRALPAVYSDVIRWVETPESAMDNGDLVAIVALARHVCLNAHIGSCGDTGLHHHTTIATTSAWSVLQPRLFPSFELKKFEAQAHAFCLSLRQELLGQRPERQSSAAQRAAELV